MWVDDKSRKANHSRDRGEIVFMVDILPPDKRRRDDDNIIASFKSGRDGIADAIGIDDCRFITRPWVHTETGGYIKVSITGGPDD